MFTIKLIITWCYGHTDGHTSCVIVLVKIYIHMNFFLMQVKFCNVFNIDKIDFRTLNINRDSK